MSREWNRNLATAVDFVFSANIWFAVDLQANSVIRSKHIAIGRGGRWKRLCLRRSGNRKLSTDAGSHQNNKERWQADDADQSLLHDGIPRKVLATAANDSRAKKAKKCDGGVSSIWSG